jgi:hypothetical protein
LASNSNHFGRGRAGVWAPWRVAGTSGARWAGSPLPSAPLVTFARAGPITTRGAFEAPFAHADFNPIGATTERAIGTPSTDARAVRTARRPRPAAIDELRQLGKLAPAKHVVRIHIKPAKEGTEIAISRPTHWTDWSALPNHVARPVRPTWTLRAARAIGIA